MTTTTTTNTFAGKTADEWRAMAKQSREDSLDSFDRCDTDGFLSQWASNQMAVRYRECAEVAERGGLTRWTVLTDLEGNRLDARQVETRYGQRWVWDGADGQAVWFSESNAQDEAVRRRNDARKGVRVETGLFVAYLDRGGRPMPDFDQFVRLED